MGEVGQNVASPIQPGLKKSKSLFGRSIILLRLRCSSSKIPLSDVKFSSSLKKSNGISEGLVSSGPY